ncbi:unnamed protein product, partial [Timema podura]|nr:unnamed protein product [Timema podura]
YLSYLICPHDSLCFTAYVLSDSGYDVWLGNVRGNKYSQSHITMLPTDPEFWNFNLHEIAVLDVPAMIDFVLRTTLKDSLVYVGHALGATYFFAMSSTLPKYNNKINTMIALAPIIFMKHLKAPIRNWLIQYADQNFFDYGLKNNMKHYSSKTPFSYELDRIHVPVNIFYSENDLIAGRKVSQLAHK